LITLPAAQPCAITGNNIANLGDVKVGEDVQDGSPSLWILVAGSERNVAFLSVSGNALRGQSDLVSLPRGGAGARAGWSSHNADPN
jgi:hypothetical protein